MCSHSVAKAVRTYLNANYMFVDEEWLMGCVHYLCRGDRNTIRDISISAKEQWLLNDLKNICPGSLPANLKSQKKTTLTGQFVVQVNTAIDIGTPAYQQYLKLQKVNVDNIDATTPFEEKIPSHRMMRLNITDGVQYLSAIEYRPMRNLPSELTPGCKVLIKGPIECRQGVLLLTENSLEILGGEVLEMGDTNSLAGQLSTKLQKIITIRVPRPDQTMVNHRRNSNIPTPHVITPPTLDYTPEPTLPKVQQPESDYAEYDIDIDQLAAIEAEFAHNSAKRPLNSDEANPEKIRKTETKNRDEDYPDDYDFLEEEDHFREIEEEICARKDRLQPVNTQSVMSSSVPAEPFVYIKQLKDMTERDGRIFKVKAQVTVVFKKLSVSKVEWKLKCTIVDGTGNLDVEFASDVVSQLAGTTPQELNIMRKQTDSKSERETKFNAILSRLKQKLEVLYCIMHTAMFEEPKVIEIKQFECTDVDLLKGRLS